METRPVAAHDHGLQLLEPEQAPHARAAEHTGVVAGHGGELDEVFPGGPDGRHLDRVVAQFFFEAGGRLPYIPAPQV